jgi:hypothetical protein
VRRASLEIAGRGRDARYWAPPAQIRIPAYGLYGTFFVKVHQAASIHTKARFLASPTSPAATS